MEHEQYQHEGGLPGGGLLRFQQTPPGDQPLRSRNRGDERSMSSAMP